MKILIVGSGYVGLVTGTCFAEVGLEVICVDIDEEKITSLSQGRCPIYEPGLEDMIRRNLEKKRLTFTSDLLSGLNEADIVFLAVGTPPGRKGQPDLTAVMAVVDQIAHNITRDLYLVIKSTVPVGTAKIIDGLLKGELSRRGLSARVEIISNPEFLKEGAAINDFMRPDRIIVGTGSLPAQEIMKRLYQPFTLNGHPIIFMDVLSAEMTKYAANGMLATKISYMNDIANLCELVGADINMVRQGIGSDPRIGPKFIYPGVGYGGSCFPKDIKALIHTAEERTYDLKILKAVEAVNERQKTVLFDKFAAHFQGNLNGRVCALWGLAFKPQTDDLREAPALALIKKLSDAGCQVKAYDPAAMKNAAALLGDAVLLGGDPYEVLIDAEALFLMTEWSEFRFPNWKVIKKLMRDGNVFDGRNIYNAAEVIQAGLAYYGIGRSMP